MGVRLRNSGKILTFDAAGTHPEPGDVVIVSTERGEEMGNAVTGPHDVAEDEVERKLKPVLRVANDHDFQIAEELRQKESEATERFRELVSEMGLDMKPVAVEALFDGRKMVFYFTAEERVDFRGLVKKLASEFNVRVDMRQIGVRDEARMLGGVGHCGEQLCCVRLGGEFEPVSIRMAKAQDLPLNPLKISGLCGRLMCCLRYEYPVYKEFKSAAPKVGAKIQTPKGEARVVSHDALTESVVLQLGDVRFEVPLEKMECAGCQSGKPCAVSGEVLASLEDAALGLALAQAGPDEDAGSGGKRTRRSRASQKQDSSDKSGGGRSKKEPATKSGRGKQRKPKTQERQVEGKSRGGRKGDAGGQGGAQPSSDGSGGDSRRRRRRRRPRKS